MKARFFQDADDFVEEARRGVIARGSAATCDTRCAQRLRLRARERPSPSPPREASRAELPPPPLLSLSSPPRSNRTSS